MGNYLKTIEAQRIRTPLQGRRALTAFEINAIRPGQRYEYRGKNTPTYCAIYDAEVVQVTEQIVTLRLTIDQTYLDCMKLGAARSFLWSIQRQDIGKSEMLFERING